MSPSRSLRSRPLAHLLISLGLLAVSASRATLCAQTLSSHTNYSGQNLANGDYHNQSISNSNFTGANLSGSNFEFAALVDDNFTNANLFGVNFWRARFANTTFAGADLRNTIFNATEFQNVKNLVGANFSGTSLASYVAVGANFTNANLSNANLTGTRFSSANLTGANVTGADFTGASLDNANLTNSTITAAQLASTGSVRSNLILSGVNFTSDDFGAIALSRVTFSGTNFTSAKSSGADFSHGDFRAADFTQAQFTHSNFSSASFYNTIATSADFSGSNFQNASLDGTYLTNANLTGANLSRSTLTWVRTSGANFTSANFTSATLKGANLSNTVMTGADFTSADLTGTTLSGNARNANFTLAKLNSGTFSVTDFRGADFTNATTTGAGFYQADLRETNITGGQLSVAYKNLYQTNLSGLTLTNLSFTNGNADSVNFAGATLNNADFTGSRLWDANFTNANVSGANFTNAQVYYAYFAGADLRGTWLTGAQLAGANKNLSATNLANKTLSNANFNNFNFQGATLTDVKFESGTLWNADFTNTNLARVNFTGAQLYSTILTGANLTGAWITPAQLATANPNLSGITLTNYNFSSANLSNLNFSDATLTGMSFQSGNLYRNNFSGANLSGANLSYAALDQASFTGANLTNANFSGASLRETSVLTSQLSGANFAGATFQGTTIGDASRSDGFIYSGQLDLGAGSSLTLASAGRAKIGSLTTLASNATLTAAHGLELDAGSTLRGTGTLATPNNAADASVLHGTVQSSGLKFTGYVRGDAAYTGAVTFSSTLELSNTVNNFAGTSGQITLNGGHLIATGNTSIARPFLLASNASNTISAAAGATLTLSGRIDGQTLNVQGPGTLALTGENLFNRLILASGSLRVGSAENLNYTWDETSTVTFDGGALQAAASFSTTHTTILAAGGGTFEVGSGLTLDWNGAIAGEGSLTKIGAGTLLLGGAGTYTGDTFVNGGILRLTSASAFNEHTTLHVAEGATFDTNGFDPNVGGVGGAGTVQINSGGLTLNGSGNETFGGKYTGTGQLSIARTGTLTLTGANTYTGGTSIDGGTLEIAGGGSIAHPDAALAIGNSSEAAALHVTNGSLTAGATEIGKVGNSSLVISGPAATATLDAVYIGWGTGTGTLEINSGGQLITNGTAAWGPNPLLPVALTVSGAGSVWNNATWFNVSGNASLAIRDGGTVATGTMSIGSSFNTATTIVGNQALLNVNTLNIASNGRGSLVIESGGTVVADAASIGQYNFGTVSVEGEGKFQANILTLYTRGTLTLGGAPDSAAKAAGTLAIGSIDSVSGGRINFNHTNATYAFDTPLTGTARLTQNGPGTTVLSGNNSNFTGALEINAGTLRVESNFGSSATTINAGGTLGGSGTIGAFTLNSGGTLAPGNSPGALHAGDTTWQGGANYVWEINDAASPGTGAGTRYDLLSVSGTLTIAATSGNKFTITLASLLADNTAGNVVNFNSDINSSYTIASASGGIIGFDANAFTINSAGFFNATNGGSWNLSHVGNNLNLNFAAASAIPEPSAYAVFFGAGALAFAFYRRRQRK
ncbi:beta strand repeat-containing protein [Oleiharenicola lentus]|uniref:beta strand repeat-containing protein n=1 Tax=Oleiharenicola lentus TaxID=2508720 RepID=UPI003F66778D